MHVENLSKRQRLIESAYAVFASEGYNNSSIKDVAEHAGITPGLVHYYFSSKEELLIAVQKAAQTRYHQRYATADGTLEPAEVLQEIKARALDDPDWYRWRYELYSLGLKGGKLQKEAAAVLDEGRRSLTSQLQGILPSPSRAQHLAAVLVACFDGLALQKILDTSFDLDAAYGALSELLEHYLSSNGSGDVIA